MLTHPTIDKLQALRRFGMMHALQEQQQTPDCASRSFEERLGLLVDREAADCDNLLLARCLQKAHLRQSAVVEDVDSRHPRGLDRSRLLALASCKWVHDHDNCLHTGPTGVGRTYLACALAPRACSDGFRVHYVRVTRLFQELAVARADGTYHRRHAALARFDLLVLDDRGLAAIDADARRDLLEILDDRYDQRATLVAAQLPVEHWHEHIGDPTLADGILDRLMHNAHRIALNGDSLRRKHAASARNEAATT